MVRPDSDLTLEALAERIEGAGERALRGCARDRGRGCRDCRPSGCGGFRLPRFRLRPCRLLRLHPCDPGAPMPASQPSAAPASRSWSRSRIVGRTRWGGACRVGATRRCSAVCGAVAQAGEALRRKGRRGVSAPSTRIARDAISGSVRRGPSDQLKASLQNPAALRSACGRRCWRRQRRTRLPLRRAVPQHKSGVRRGQGHVDHRVPAEELVRLQRRCRSPTCRKRCRSRSTRRAASRCTSRMRKGGAVATAAAPAARPAPTSVSAPSPTPRPTPAPAQRPQQPQQAAPAVSCSAPRPMPCRTTTYLAGRGGSVR